jgi:xanthine dehydrogenase YagS FAD-binding subunit
MKPFQYVRAKDLASAQEPYKNGCASFLAGGTTLLDLMKINVMCPDTLVDINRIGLNDIDRFSAGFRVGANVRNNELAWNPEIRKRFTVLSEALLSGASAQLRQMATTAGNILQRSRCPYFRDETSACNKRNPGSGCDGKTGYDRTLAVLGTSEACIATHPSDMCVALIALDAVIHTRKMDGTERKIPFGEFHCLPGNNPDRENVLENGEIIQHVFIPHLLAGVKSHYLKVRDRSSYDFALASAAVALHIHDSGIIEEIRIALGGLATKPWRATEAERVLHGQKYSPELFEHAAEAEMKNARAGRFNRFKIELGKRTIVSALTKVASEFATQEKRAIA